MADLPVLRHNICMKEKNTHSRSKKDKFCAKQPNKETIAAIKETKNLKSLKRVKTVDELFKFLDKD